MLSHQPETLIGLPYLVRGVTRFGTWPFNASVRVLSVLVWNMGEIHNDARNLGQLLAPPSSYSTHPPLPCPLSGSCQCLCPLITFRCRSCKAGKQWLTGSSAECEQYEQHEWEYEQREQCEFGCE